MIYIKYIIEGWFNEIFKFFISKKYKKEFAERLSICEVCEHNINGRCDLCGCFVKAKTKVPELECQLRKWKSLKN